MKRALTAALIAALILTACAAPDAPVLPPADGGPETAPIQDTPVTPPDTPEGPTEPDSVPPPDEPESPDTQNTPEDNDKTDIEDAQTPPDREPDPAPPEDRGEPETGDEPGLPDTVNPADAPGQTDLPNGDKKDGNEDKTDIPWGKLPNARPSSAGKLSVTGRYLTSADGRAVQLRGVSTHGLAWFPQYVNAELFRELSEDWGCSAVRLALYTAEYGGWCTGGDRDALLKLIYDGVGFAADSDMYAIVDWHILSDGDPNTYKSEAMDFFSTVSKDLAGYDNVLYEICNEPNGGVTWARVKSYALEVIAAIRESDPDAVILVGTPNWCQYLDEAVRDPITEYDNIMYTLHFYAATHTDALRGTMLDAVSAGLPLFVSEFGICDASGNGRIDEAQADKWREEMDLNYISYMMWSLSNKAESASVISSSCQKTSGFTGDDLTQGGKWLLNALSGTASTANPQPEDPAQPERPTDPAGPEVLPGIPGPSFDEPAGGYGEVSWVLETVNSWESGGRRFCQYSLTVKNETGTDITTWTASLDLGSPFNLESSWNGVFEPSGSGLAVTPMDYNSSIPPGGTARDVGFIVSFD